MFVSPKLLFISSSTFHLPITGLSFTASWLSLVGIALLQQKQQAKEKHKYVENLVLDMFSSQFPGNQSLIQHLKKVWGC